MEKKLSVCCSSLILFLFLIMPTSALSYVYTLDIDIPDPGLITEVESMIGGVLFETSGGVFGDDWQVTLGNAIPVATGNWIFDSSGMFSAVFDDFDWSNPDFAPMVSGNVLTITSDVELTFSYPDFFSFRGPSVDSEYFTTDGFVEQSAVPIPGGIILLGSGLLGLLGISRRR